MSVKLNIAMGKVGKSIKFRAHKYTPAGGDNEPVALLRALANNNRDVHFYLVGKSDADKLPPGEWEWLFPHGNVTNVWSGITHAASKIYTDKKARRDVPVTAVGSRKTGETGYVNKWDGNVDNKHYRWLLDWFPEHGVELDYGVMMVGQMSTATLPGITRLVNDPSKTTTPYEMTWLYAAPIIRWLNETRLPYLEVVNDPRYILGQARDLTNLPKVCLSQYDDSYSFSHFEDYETQEHKRVTVKRVYAGMETMFCVGRDKPNLVEVAGGRDVDFAVVLNEGYKARFGGYSRYDVLNEWVLKQFPDVAIYGEWKDPRALADPRFKGPVKLEDLQVMLRRVKATLCIPIHKGWVTSKYVEMAHAGVVPFLHPTYDEQGHVPVHPFLRAKNPAELAAKVRAVTSDDVARAGVLTSLQSLLRPAYYDGTYLSREVMGRIYEDRGMTYREPDETWTPAPPPAPPAESNLEAFFT